jgi:hypothetical protein
MLLPTLLFLSSQSFNYEKNLRNDLFSNNSVDENFIIPREDLQTPLNVEMGIVVQTLEEFNQKVETIQLNLWVRMNWNNSYLTWDPNNYGNISFIIIDPKKIWHPDIELYNAASLPEIYKFDDRLYLYDNGNIFWSRPGIFKFSCSMDLNKFPFDTQNCSMTFGSWVYEQRFLNLKPYDDYSKAVDIFTSFSHGEWDVKNIYLDNFLSDNKTLIKYTIELQRFSHYYMLSIGMTITLVYVSIIIMFLPSDNISRTSTAVFIPLTILALQLTIVDKVPVVGYFTTMDKFFLSCFVCSMFVSIESGIIYALINIKNKNLLKFTYNSRIYQNCNQEEKNSTSPISNNTPEDEQNQDSSDPDIIRTVSYRKAINNVSYNFSNNIYKTISHNDKLLFLDNKEQNALLFIKLCCKYIDNFFRFVVPFTFTIYIAVILN